MTFRKYESLAQTSAKTLLWHQDHPEVIGHTLFNVIEKIHGCNYQFHRDVWGTLKCGKRTQFLHTDSKFYGHNLISAEHGDNFLKTCDAIYGKNHEVTLYGEMFGGGANNTRPVQREVWYSNNFEFAAFDLYVDGKLQSYSDMKYFCEIAKIPTCPVIAENLTFQEAIKVNNTFNSKWSEESEALEDNICEGVVLQPTEPTFYENGDRIIFKNKNSIFLEKHTGKKPGKGSTDRMTPEQLEVYTQLGQYVTVQRFEAVVSKIDEDKVNFQNFKLVLDAYIDDIFDEIKREGVTLDADIVQALRKPLHNRAAMLIRKQLTELQLPSVAL